ncbi:MAG: sulfotransferase [Thermoleophilaceae bacterium]|nr:sulfotransferase [Thermoleophilaceae bacterium]
MLGMHRCGTSLTASVLDLLGFSLAAEVSPLQPAPDNPRGSWEQRPITEINDALLEALGGSWSSPPDMPPDWERSPELEPLRERAREVVDAQFADAGEWTWKDPRTSLTLPFWRELLPPARYVVCLRNPADVAASLLRRAPDTLTWEAANALWLRYGAEALDNTGGDERLLVFYEDYFSDPEWQLARLAAFVGRDLTDVPESVRAELDGVIEEDLRHHRTSAREPALSEAIEGFVPNLWRHAEERRTAARQERDEAVALARLDRDRARREERHARAALDRALEELEWTRGEMEAAGAALEPAADGASPALGLDYAGGQRERSVMRAQAEAAHERRARVAIEESLSWRVTRPLRVAKGALAGPRGRLRAIASARRRGPAR